MIGSLTWVGFYAPKGYSLGTTYVNDTVLLYNKSSEASIKTWSTPASLSFKRQATKHTTVKWCIFLSCMFS